MLGRSLAKGVEHDRRGQPRVRADVHGVAGAVVEPGEDLHGGAIGKRIVGEVGLQGLVRHGRFEAEVGGLGSLLRFACHQACAGQAAADGGGRHDDSVVLGQVPGDGLRSGVQTSLGQLLAQPQDQVDDLGSQRVGSVVRSS
jgi:hypothetical protein